MIWLLFWSASAFGATFIEDFSTNEWFDETNSTPVLNLGLGRVHPPFVIDRDQDGDEDDELDIGTGKDGPFNADTFADFDVDTSSTTITLETSRVYEFTEFNLPAGMTLTGSGDEPLRIRVQGTVTIAGTIDVSGTDGGAGTSSTSVAPTVGEARCCGGASGGKGGILGAAAEAGMSSSETDNTQGLPGTNGSAGNGAGGGGGGGNEDTFNPAATGGSPAGGGTGGSAGADTSDVYLSVLTGGGGGGGGGAYLDNPAPAQASGGSGGGGGGVVQIFSGGRFRVEATGQILANGGDGGSVAGPMLSGGGGGGGGGQIFLATGDLLFNLGNISAVSGDGGSANGTGDGGDGGYGRTRFVDKTTSGWKFNEASGTEDPTPNLADFGRVFSVLEEVVLVSKSIDTLNSFPTFESATIEAELGTGDSASLEVAGSNTNFENDLDGDTGFVAATSVAQLNGKRYYRFRLRLQAGARTNFPYIDSVTIQYSERQEREFRFKAVSCARIHPNDSTEPWGFLSFILFLLLLPRLIRAARSRIGQSPQTPDERWS